MFTYVIDPIGAGFIAAWHAPAAISPVSWLTSRVVGKWVQMLKEFAPQTTRVALLGNPKMPLITITHCTLPRPQRRCFGIEVVPSRIENDAVDIERAIAAIASVRTA